MHTQVFAVKFLRDCMDARSEISTQLKALPSEDVVAIVDVFENTTRLPHDMMARRWLVVVMEAMHGGELFYRIKDRQALSEGDTRQVVRQVARALAHLHALDITHRDVKPENLLLAAADGWDLKLSDFGFATDKPPVSGKYTPMYAAPEVLKSSASRQMLGGRGIPYTSACDVWSLGVVMYICLCGYTPFAARPGDVQARIAPELRNQIMAAKFDFPDDPWAHISPEAKDLIRRCLTVDVNARITAAQVLAHPWLQPADAEAAAPEAEVAAAATAAAAAAATATATPQPEPEADLTLHVPQVDGPMALLSMRVRLDCTASQLLQRARDQAPALGSGSFHAVLQGRFWLANQALREFVPLLSQHVYLAPATPTADHHVPNSIITVGRNSAPTSPRRCSAPTSPRRAAAPLSPRRAARQPDLNNAAISTMAANAPVTPPRVTQLVPLSSSKSMLLRRRSQRAC